MAKSQGLHPSPISPRLRRIGLSRTVDYVPVGVFGAHFGLILRLIFGSLTIDEFYFMQRNLTILKTAGGGIAF